MNFRLLPLAVLALISGCATAYQKDGITGGFVDTRLAPDMVRVTFAGNGFTSDQKATDFALLRAAELCAESGCGFFSVQWSPVSTQMANAGGGVAKPEVAVMAKFFKDKPAGVDVFDAGFLINSIKSKYGIR